MDVINGELFKQAYKSSVDASEYLDRYQMYKLLKGPFDKEGACIIVTAVSDCVASEVSWLVYVLTVKGYDNSLRNADVALVIISPCFK